MKIVRANIIKNMNLRYEEKTFITCLFLTDFDSPIHPSGGRALDRFLSCCIPGYNIKCIDFFTTYFLELIAQNQY